MSEPSPPRPFPEFLRAAYAEEALSRTDAPIVALDPQTAILWVNPAWDRFARDNGGAFTSDDYPTYLDGISGELRGFYADVFDAALAGQEVYEQDYECSSAETKRLFRMRVLPFGSHGLMVEHNLVAASAMVGTGEPAVEAEYLDAAGNIVQCSNCRKVRRPSQDDSEFWVWIPAWVTHSHARTSHGICTPCLGFYWQQRRKRR